MAEPKSPQQIEALELRKKISGFLYDIHPMRKYVEFLLMEHKEGRGSHNSYPKDIKKSFKYNSKNYGRKNKRGVTAEKWVTSIIDSEMYLDPVIALGKSLTDKIGKKYPRPDEIELKYTRIPLEAYKIANDAFRRKIIDMMITDGEDLGIIAREASKIRNTNMLDTEIIARYKYFFWNVSSPDWLGIHIRYLKDLLKYLITEEESLKLGTKKMFHMQHKVLSGQMRYEVALYSIGASPDTVELSSLRNMEILSLRSTEDALDVVNESDEGTRSEEARVTIQTAIEVTIATKSIGGDLSGGRSALPETVVPADIDDVPEMELNPAQKYKAGIITKEEMEKEIGASKEKVGKKEKKPKEKLGKPLHRKV